MKDRQSKMARDLDRFTAHRRLLLTGTPLQNDLRELWSLLNLLLPSVRTAIQLGYTSQYSILEFQDVRELWSLVNLLLPSVRRCCYELESLSPRYCCGMTRGNCGVPLTFCYLRHELLLLGRQSS